MSNNILYRLRIGNNVKWFNTFGGCYFFFVKNFTFIKHNPELRWWDGSRKEIYTDNGDLITIEIERVQVSQNNMAYN